VASFDYPSVLCIPDLQLTQGNGKTNNLCLAWHQVNALEALQRPLRGFDTAYVLPQVKLGDLVTPTSTGIRHREGNCNIALAA
jgi:hypothetical protein